MVPEVERLKSSDTLPDKTEVVIIGGGIVGILTAFALAKKRIPVVVCEKGEVAGEQSGRNQGWCRLQNRDPREVPLMLESLTLWHQMSNSIAAEGGFHQCGSMTLLSTQEAAEQATLWLRAVEQYDTHVRIIGRNEVSKLLPGAAERWAGAL